MPTMVIFVQFPSEMVKPITPHAGMREIPSRSRIPRDIHIPVPKYPAFGTFWKSRNIPVPTLVPGRDPGLLKSRLLLDFHVHDKLLLKNIDIENPESRHVSRGIFLFRSRIQFRDKRSTGSRPGPETRTKSLSRACLPTGGAWRNYWGQVERDEQQRRIDANNCNNILFQFFLKLLAIFRVL